MSAGMLAPTTAPEQAESRAVTHARAYLMETAGLCFEGARRSALVATLEERARHLGSLTAYLELIASPSGVAERQSLLDAVTVQETSFFRNAPQMEALRRVVLPELLRRAAMQGRPFLAWSAGCATGEEPYSVAMMALEVRSALRIDVEIRVLGTDVSAAALDAARVATYAGRTLSAVPAASRSRWFVDVASGARVTDEVRDVVSLRLHNLVTEAPPRPADAIDLVLCRNVTIYFSRRTTRGVVGQLARVLRPDGYLLLGHAETLWRLSDEFTLSPIGEAFAYRKAVGVPQPRTTTRRAPAGRITPTGSADAHGSPVSAAPQGSSSSLRDSRAHVAPPMAQPLTTVTPADARLTQAREALAVGRYAQAVLEAARAVDLDPLASASWGCLGQALTCRGRDGDAVAALRKAVYLDPLDGAAHFLLAGALARLGQLGAAAVAYEAAAVALPRVPGEALAHVLDGRDVGELALLCKRLAAELGSGPTRRDLR